MHPALFQTKLPTFDVASPGLFRCTCVVYVVLTVITSPLTDPQAVAALLDFYIPFEVVKPLRNALLKVCHALFRFRKAYEWFILMWHEVFTGISADILAQSIEGFQGRVNWRRGAVFLMVMLYPLSMLYVEP